uniref:Uncharacterized protein n=1 Tax=Chenopodium quinoa TaxID=63459 RepID=A0A803MBD9_CHEQI
MALLSLLSSYSWDAKVAIALTALAIAYREFGLVVKLFSSHPLAKSVALLKHLPTKRIILRHAKDIAENNKGARILIVWAETVAVNFHGPFETHIESLVGQALNGDGAAVVIVGVDPDFSIERQCFQIVSGTQRTIPYTQAHWDRRLELDLLDYPQWWCSNSNGIESKLQLDVEKLEVTRHVLSEYGNMTSVGVLFMMDEMRKRSLLQGKMTTGFGCEWCVMVGFGPGLTIEALALRSVPIHE